MPDPRTSATANRPPEVTVIVPTRNAARTLIEGGKHQLRGFHRLWHALRVHDPPDAATRRAHVCGAWHRVPGSKSRRWRDLFRRERDEPFGAVQAQRMVAHHRLGGRRFLPLESIGRSRPGHGSQQSPSVWACWFLCIHWCQGGVVKAGTTSLDRVSDTVPHLSARVPEASPLAAPGPRCPPLKCRDGARHSLVRPGDSPSRPPHPPAFATSTATTPGGAP